MSRDWFFDDVNWHPPKCCMCEREFDDNDKIFRHSSGNDAYCDVCFVDDDDVVPCYYVSTILPLLDGVDIIGFEAQLYVDGDLDPHRDYHTITAGSWYNTEDAFYRDISHLQPIRREVALAAPMEGGHGEDGRWADNMRALKVIKTEHYIDKIMYYYLFRNGKNRGAICPFCGRDSTVMVEVGTHCNSCGRIFNLRDASQKSCLWI